MYAEILYIFSLKEKEKNTFLILISKITEKITPWHEMKINATISIISMGHHKDKWMKKCLNGVFQSFAEHFSVYSQQRVSQITNGGELFIIRPVFKSRTNSSNVSTT